MLRKDKISMFQLSHGDFIIFPRIPVGIQRNVMKFRVRSELCRSYHVKLLSLQIPVEIESRSGTIFLIKTSPGIYLSKLGYPKDAVKK